MRQNACKGRCVIIIIDQKLEMNQINFNNLNLEKFTIGEWLVLPFDVAGSAGS